MKARETMIEKTINTDTEIEALQHVRNMSNVLNVSCDVIKPCVAYLWATGAVKGSRNDSAFILATEFREYGFPEEKALQELNEWNSRLPEKLDAQKLKYRVPSAYKQGAEGQKIKGGYKVYGCNGPLSQYCILGKDNCPYYKSHFPKNNGERSMRGMGIPTFFYMGWWKYLKLAELKAYCGIVELEKKRGLKPSNLIIASQALIATHAHLSVPIITPTLTSLVEHGLILCKTGEQHFNKHIATKVSRVIPIPPARPKSLKYLNEDIK